MCHLVLLLPLLALPVFWLWPLGVALPVYSLVLLLSAGVYYLALAAMHRRVMIGPETLLHSRGKVVSGYGGGLCMRVQDDLWRARSKQPLEPGDSVEVTGIDGLTLRVVGRSETGRAAHPHSSARSRVTAANGSTATLSSSR
jgi:membrane protein implicated in regulation of membrane protease activity